MPTFAFYFLSFSMIALSIGCAQNLKISEGVVQESRTFINFKDSMEVPYFKIENKIWFNDSLVIYEINVIKEIINQPGSGTARQVSVIFSRYTFLDLRTMQCQNYHQLSDTAKPYAFFYLKPEESISWNFYGHKSTISDSTKFFDLSDTLINNSKLKRVQAITKHGEQAWQNMYYLDCNYKQSIFHFNRSIDSLYPGCKVVRSDIKDLKTPVTNIFEYQFLKDKLSDEEKNIFKAWSLNLKTTKLPMITYTESLKMNYK